MASFFRRAAGAIAQFFSTTDPGGTTGLVKVYQKSGQLYAQVPAGSVYQITPINGPSSFAEWVPIDVLTPSAATGTISFKTGGNGSQNYAVDGNTDLWYKVTWDVAISAGSCTLQLNAASTNQSSQRLRGDNTTVTSNQTATNAVIANAPRSSGEWICRRTNTGATRVGTMLRIAQTAASTADQIEICGWLYNDSATNITSIDFLMSGADTITGQIVLWKKGLFPWEV